MKVVRFRENLGLRFGDSFLEIHGPRGVKLVDLNKPQMNLLKRLWEDGLSAGEIAASCGPERSLLKALSAQKLLRLFEEDYSRDETWLSHFVPDARRALSDLARKRVMIAGCGGTGAIIADHLARAGLRNFVLVDGADLDAPDLNRQWTFSAGQIGRAKVELLAAHLRENFGAEVKPYRRFLAAAGDLADLREEECDLIVWCADKPRRAIEKLALALAEVRDTPLLFGAVGITDDQVGAVALGVEGRERERARIRADEAFGFDARTIRGSLCFTNTMAAAKIGLVAYRFLLGLN